MDFFLNEFYDPFIVSIDTFFVASFQLNMKAMEVCLFVRLVSFYGISTIVGYLMPNTYKQFYFKQFSLAQVQFFVYTQLNVKTVLFQTI